MNGSIRTVDGTLTDISFHHGTTVTYQLADGTPVDGRTIVIPDGYPRQERIRIRQALRRLEADRPTEQTERPRLTDGMVRIAVMRMLCDDCACTPTQADDLYTAWQDQTRRQAITGWVDGLPMREATRLHMMYLEGRRTD